jgi:hypothetical protein
VCGLGGRRKGLAVIEERRQPPPFDRPGPPAELRGDELVE